jgi:hypothetical protein
MLVPRPKPVTFDPHNAQAIDIAPEAVPVAAPGAGEVINAAFRQENLVGSLIAQQTAGGERNPDYNAWDDIKGTPYEEHWQRFAANAWNPGQTAALKRQIDMEMGDRNTLAAAGGWGILATMGAGIFSPENLLPGGAVVRGIRTGQAIARSALSTASAAAIGAAAAEVGLQATQETRTPLESAFNVGGAALLGGALGAGLSAVFAKSDFARLGKQLEQEGAAGTDTRTLFENEAAMLDGAGAPGSAGAAAARLDSLDDLSIAGFGAQVAGGAVKGLNPVLRILHSPSAIVRDVGTRLFENPVYLKKNMEGIASTAGVETLVKQYTQGALARAVGATNSLYGEYRKTGGQMDRLAFNEAVGRAMRRGDVDANPVVAKAAQAWRKDVFDPLKDRAIEAGLLPKDVSVDTALSYFTRVYNRPMIEAREADFKAIVRRYIAQEVRSAEARAQMAKLDPRYEAPKTELPGFVSEADRQSYVDEIVNSIYNTITGRNVDGDIPRDIVPTKRGPLKERTFHIPDTEIEEFLESNVEAVGRRYARTMAADVELTTAFGKADLKEQIDQIRADYEKMRAAVSAGHDPATGAEMQKALTDKQKAKEIERLNRAEKNDIRDLEALRDMLRGTYKAEENATNFARAARVAGTINYLRALGGVTISSLGDVARHVMVHGMTNVMQDGLVPLISNLKGFKLSVQEARIAGAVTERLLNTRMATWAEISDPYSVSSPFERFMENTAAGFSRVNGMVYWNDFQKAFASVLTQNRVLRGSGDYSRLGKRERAYLAFLGIDGSMAERIARQFQAHGTVEPGNVRVANSDDWTDEVARRTYRAAILKDVDTTIVTKGVGDVPLFMNTPLGRLAGQFKSFALASHQRVLMRGLQERPMGFVSGTMMAATVGMMIYYLKSIEANRAEDISDNPGRWIAEGLDRSGIFSIAFEVNNTVEKHFGIGAYGALMAAFPGSQEGAASRYLSRSAWATVGGPTADLIDTVLAAGNAIKGTTEGWTEGEINSIRRLVPGASLPGIRSFVEYVGVPAAAQALN